jgi:predicted dehydrogenase
MIDIAVLGCGYWGPNLLRNFCENRAFNVVACADPSPARFEHLSLRYPSVRFVTDYASLITDPKVQALAIATPSATHYPLAMEAMLAGKHVLVEKPLTTSTSKARELVQVAEQRGVTLMVDHTFVFTGAVRKIRELIESGALGQIYYFDSVRINLGMFRHDVNVLWDLAPHDLSIMEYVLPERPASVSAVGQAHINHEVIDVAHVSVHYDSSLMAHVHCNWLAPVKVRQIIIGGSRRMLLYDDSEPSEKVKVYDRGINVDARNTDDIYKMLVQYRSGDMTAPRLDTREALEGVCEHFAECILTGRKPITGGQAGLNVVRVLEAAERSLHEDSRRVAV